MDLEALVALVAEEVRRILAERAAPPRRLLVVLTGTPCRMDAVTALLADIRTSGRFKPTLLLSHTAARRVDRHRLAETLGSAPALDELSAPSPTKLAWDADLVLVPWLSLNSAAKLATGVCDTLVTAVLMLALLRGIPVLACADELDPDRPALGAWARPAPALAAHLRSTLATLRAFGMELVDSEHLTAAILGAGASAPAVQPAAEPVPRPSRRQVITEADVQAAAAAGGLHRLPADGLWTPLAREAMHRYR